LKEFGWTLAVPAVYSTFAFLR